MSKAKKKAAKKKNRRSTEAFSPTQRAENEVRRMIKVALDEANIPADVELGLHDRTCVLVILKDEAKRQAGPIPYAGMSGSGLLFVDESEFPSENSADWLKTKILEHVATAPKMLLVLISAEIVHYLAANVIPEHHRKQKLEYWQGDPVNRKGKCSCTEGKGVAIETICDWHYIEGYVAAMQSYVTAIAVQCGLSPSEICFALRGGQKTSMVSPSSDFNDGWRDGVSVCSVAIDQSDMSAEAIAQVAEQFSKHGRSDVPAPGEPIPPSELQTVTPDGISNRDEVMVDSLPSPNACDNQNLCDSAGTCQGETDSVQSAAHVHLYQKGSHAMPNKIPSHASIHYKCSFDIYGDPNMGTVKNIIQAWRHRKVKRYGLSGKSTIDEESGDIFGKDYFGFGTLLESSNNSKAIYKIIRTVCKPGEEIDYPVCWALEMIHEDEMESNRYWSTEIILQKRPSDCIRFVTIVKHFVEPYYLGQTLPSPSPWTPEFISEIIWKSASLLCKKGDSIISPLCGNIQPRGVKEVFEALKSPQRLLPFIFIAKPDDEKKYPLNVIKLTENVKGNANVYVLENRTAINTLNKYLIKLIPADNNGSHEPHAFYVEPGTVRIFPSWRDFSKTENSRQHRSLVFHIKEEGDEKIQQDITNVWSRLAPTQPGDLLSFQDVLSAIRKHKIRELIRVRDSLSIDRGSLSTELNAFIESYNKELKEWKALLEHGDEENTNLKSENSQLKYRVGKTDKLREERDDLQTEVDDMSNLLTKGLSKLPGSLEAILKLAVILFHTKIEIAPEAYASAEDYFNEHISYWQRIENLNIAWDMIKDFVNILHPILFESPIGGHEQLFKKAGSKFKYATSEGPSTTQDGKLRRERRIIYDGETLDISPHLVHKKSPPELLRLHFYQDNKKKKLIIGHFGVHKETASGKK
jgi:hypothetical protein